MTETLSHIALRRLNGKEASDWYTPFDSVRIRLSKEDTLIIYAPNVCAEELATNDIAEINEEGKFRILGRKDNTINSGGVKIQIEQVEALLQEHLSIPIQITAAPDTKFGEIVVLLYPKVEDVKAIKAVCEISVHVFGIVIDLKLMQASKAYSEMFVVFDGISKSKACLEYFDGKI